MNCSGTIVVSARDREEPEDLVTQNATNDEEANTPHIREKIINLSTHRIMHGL